MPKRAPGRLPTNAILVPSGDQSGAPPGTPDVFTRSTGSDPSALTDHTPPDRPDSSSTLRTSLVPSAVQSGWYSKPGMLVMRRTPAPSALPTYTPSARTKASALRPSSARTVALPLGWAPASFETEADRRGPGPRAEAPRSVHEPSANSDHTSIAATTTRLRTMSSFAVGPSPVTRRTGPWFPTRTLSLESRSLHTRRVQREAGPCPGTWAGLRTRPALITPELSG